MNEPKICRHCGRHGRQYTITDSEGKACKLRTKKGHGKEKELVIRAFSVCPKCYKINLR